MSGFKQGNVEAKRLYPISTCKAATAATSAKVGSGESKPVLRKTSRKEEGRITKRRAANAETTMVFERRGIWRGYTRRIERAKRTVSVARERTVEVVQRM